MNSRQGNIDFLKGVIILLVVIGHFVQNNWVDSMEQHPIYNWIYGFHMAVFFFISGYLTQYTVKAEYHPFREIKKRFLSMMIPYLTWCYLIRNILYKTTDFKLDYLYNPDHGYWFVYMIFLFYVFFVGYHLISSKLLKMKINTVVTEVFSVIIIFAVLGCCYLLMKCELFSRALQFIPLFILGFLCCKYKLIEYVIQRKFILFLFTTLFIILSVQYNYDQGPVYHKVLKLAVGICASISFFAVSKIADINYDNRLIKLLCYAGKNSIVIYLTHFHLIKVFGDDMYWFNEFTPGWTFIISFFASVIICLMSLFIGKLLETVPLLNRIVYGK